MRVRVPQMSWKDENGHKLDASDMSSTLNSAPRRHVVAYWHFKASARRRDERGRWHLLKLSELPASERASADGGKTYFYVDCENKRWPCVVPNNSLREFISGICATRVHPKDRWRQQLARDPDASTLGWACKLVHPALVQAIATAVVSPVIAMPLASGAGTDADATVTRAQLRGSQPWALRSLTNAPATPARAMGLRSGGTPAAGVVRGSPMGTAVKSFKLDPDDLEREQRISKKRQRESDKEAFEQQRRMAAQAKRMHELLQASGFGARFCRPPHAICHGTRVH